MISKSNHLFNKGFYQVGSQRFFSKFQAVIQSQKTGIFPQWNFNEDVYTQQDWAIEPPESLWEIYRQRAQQIRDTYDHVVIMFSGGSDSTNILQSFLFNDIPVDEIFMYGPFSTKQGRQGPLTRSAENMFREIDMVAIPYLNELRKNHNFAITTYDWTNDIANGFQDADWIWTDVGNRFVPSTPGKNKLFENSPLSMSKLESGKTVCFVTGIDKPRLILKEGVIYFAFLDYFTSLGAGHKYLIDKKDWCVEELFYWSPDMPQLVIKQAHVMKNYFLQNPDKQYLIERSDLSSWKYKESYFELAKKLIYPFWNPDAYQAAKPSKQTFLELDNWFIYSNRESRNFWLAGLEEAKKVIDPYWITQDDDPRFVGSWSKWYPISRVKSPG